ncbi:MAG: hypothetical protein K1X55_00785 [Chitinophagales bacterium]|nr:hypothetical protein [Chitinophagales bacterium]
MRRLLLIMVLIACFAKSQAQINDLETEKMVAYEDTLRMLLDTMDNSPFPEKRLNASFFVIKTLKSALKTPHSFYYPFGELPAFSVIKPTSGLFKIFTWQVELIDGSHRNFGAIQMKSDTLRLFPLVDYGDVYDNLSMQIVDNERWIGAYYYNIIEKKVKKQKYYFLFGWDGQDTLVNRKYIDVLWFKDGQPRFGAPVFQTGNGDELSMRFVLEYKDDAQVGLNLNIEEERIEYDHLEALMGLPPLIGSDKVPDGTYEGFEWKKKYWKHIDKIEYQQLQDGEFPIMETPK